MKHDDNQNSVSRGQWLETAIAQLTESGVVGVKVMSLAKQLGVARSGFYWHFRNRKALLDAIITHWEAKNTGNLEAQCEAFAESLNEAMFNLYDCWLDPKLFDGRLDLAIRSWARSDADLMARLRVADAARINAIQRMYARFGFSDTEAEVRAMAVVYTQIGYLSMHVDESHNTRIDRMPAYAGLFTGKPPTENEVKRLRARHGLKG